MKCSSLLIITGQQYSENTPYLSLRTGDERLKHFAGYVVCFLILRETSSPLGTLPQRLIRYWDELYKKINKEQKQ